MIRLFSHYVPQKLIFLASLEALFLVLSAYVGISIHVFGPSAALSGFEGYGPPQVAA